MCLCGAARSLYAKANIAGTLGKAALLADCCSLNAGADKVVAAATATATATTAAAVSAGDDGGDGDGSVKGGVPQMQETCWRPHPMPLFRTSEAALISSSPSSSGDAADAADAEGGRVPDSEGGWQDVDAASILVRSKWSCFAGTFGTPPLCPRSKTLNPHTPPFFWDFFNLHKAELDSVLQGAAEVDFSHHHCNTAATTPTDPDAPPPAAPWYGVALGCTAAEKLAILNHAKILLAAAVDLIFVRACAVHCPPLRTLPVLPPSVHV